MLLKSRLCLFLFCFVAPVCFFMSSTSGMRLEVFTTLLAPLVGAAILTCLGRDRWKAGLLAVISSLVVAGIGAGYLLWRIPSRDDMPFREYTTLKVGQFLDTLVREVHGDKVALWTTRLGALEIEIIILVVLVALACCFLFLKREKEHPYSWEVCGLIPTVVFFALQLIAADDFFQIWLSLQCLNLSSQALAMLWINPKGGQAVCLDSFEFWGLGLFLHVLIYFGRVDFAGVTDLSPLFRGDFRKYMSLVDLAVIDVILIFPAGHFLECLTRVMVAVIKGIAALHRGDKVAALKESAYFLKSLLMLVAASYVIVKVFPLVMQSSMFLRVLKYLLRVKKKK
jgi:hypothetical protein